MMSGSKRSLFCCCYKVETNTCVRLAWHKPFEYAQLFKCLTLSLKNFDFRYDGCKKNIGKFIEFRSCPDNLTYNRFWLEAFVSQLKYSSDILQYINQPQRNLKKTLKRLWNYHFLSFKRNEKKKKLA